MHRGPQANEVNNGSLYADVNALQWRVICFDDYSVQHAFIIGCEKAEQNQNRIPQVIISKYAKYMLSYAAVIKMIS